MTVVALLGAMFPATPASAAPHSHLHISTRSAVPGQIVVLGAPDLVARGAKVLVGGKRARVVSRRRHKLGFGVPQLGPGVRRVSVGSGRHRLKGRLRIARGFDGRVAPHPDRRRSASELIGPGGGEVSATALDGTVFRLSVPAGAVGPATEITLTPVKGIGDFPLSGKPAAVEFDPDGLRLSRPATLRITYARVPSGKLAGFVYGGSGRDFGLRVAKTSGKTVRLSVNHFSSAGAATISAKDMVILLGRLAAKLVAGQLTLSDVSTFAAAWSSFFAANPSDCESDPTCAFVLAGTTDLLTAQANRFRCLGATGLFDGDPPRGSEAMDSLRLGLQIDADLRLLGRNRQASQLSDARLCITRGLVQEITGPAEDDPTGITAVPITAADAGRADQDGDGQANNCEWAVQVARTAALQGFVALQSQAQDACERGLQKMLDDGAKRCEEVLTEGKDILTRGQKVAVAIRILAAEFDAALSECKPKVFVTPKSASVEVGKDQSFTARSNEGDTDFDWTTTDGTIDEDGLLTAPVAPGSLTVTATTRRILSGTATVTVTCPAGQVEFQGQCKTISVTVTPNPVSLGPGATQQFTANLTNATNTAVTWTKSAGSITANGFYTAPQAPGNYTVTATSVQDPAKKGTAQVTVGAGAINFVSRTSDTDLQATSMLTRNAGTPTGCLPGNSQQFDTDLQTVPQLTGLGPFSKNLQSRQTSFPATCNGRNFSVSAKADHQTSQNVEAVDDGLTVRFSATLHATDELTTDDPGALPFLSPSSVGIAHPRMTVVFTVTGGPVELTCTHTSSASGVPPFNSARIGNVRIDGPNLFDQVNEDNPSDTFHLPAGTYQLSLNANASFGTGIYNLSHDSTKSTTMECDRTA